MPGGIVIIFGLPATGKTTLSNRLASTKEFESCLHIWIVDDIKNQGTLRDKNDFVFELVKRAIDLNPNEIQLIDDTFHLHSMRKRYINLAIQYKIGLAMIHLESPLEELIERNRMRSNFLDETVIKKMSKVFEPLKPTLSSKYQVRVKDDCDALAEAVVEKLAETRRLHEESCEAILRMSDEPNFTHQLNLLLNRAVSVIMQTHPERRLAASKLIAAKRILFDEFRALYRRQNITSIALASVEQNDHDYFIKLLLSHKNVEYEI